MTPLLPVVLAPGAVAPHTSAVAVAATFPCIPRSCTWDALEVRLEVVAAAVEAAAVAAAASVDTSVSVEDPEMLHIHRPRVTNTPDSNTTLAAVAAAVVQRRRPSVAEMAAEVEPAAAAAAEAPPWWRALRQLPLDRAVDYYSSLLLVVPRKDLGCSPRSRLHFVASVRLPFGSTVVAVDFVGIAAAARGVNECGFAGCDVRVSGCGCTLHAVSS